MNWIENNGNVPKTIQESYFNPTRLLTLQSRQSAAYKGIMALILKNHCKDFISGREMDFTVYKSENIDIHHIFPRSYCEKNNLSKEKWNSVVNKTPISYSTNREIGGVAPSEYLKKIEEKGQVDYNSLNDYLQTHLIDVSAARSNDFEKHIVLRAKLLLDAIEKATGKIISGKDSDEVISKFGERLIF
ncbi:MAG: HNH endonuclease domain-containing protein [Ruminococcus bromii]|nr:HNH endonuclease domain-containing protein [Ruminococcus bromii]